jgi:hypothetical protein
VKLTALSFPALAVDAEHGAVVAQQPGLEGSAVETPVASERPVRAPVERDPEDVLDLGAREGARARLRQKRLRRPRDPGIAGACARRTAAGVVPGLGRVTANYTRPMALGPPSCANGLGKALAHSLRLVVAGKGEIEVTVGDGLQCVDAEVARIQPQPFTVTAGTGLYAGATGSGTVTRALGPTATGAAGIETFAGTLSVAGLDSDLTARTFKGAVGRTVRAARGARSLRERYLVTALDAVDGWVPASCRPRSGSRFPIGRTSVTCAAGDSSGNTRTARFVITVRRPR